LPGGENLLAKVDNLVLFYVLTYEILVAEVHNWRYFSQVNQ
jgi:hypothetical protein